MLPPPPLSPRTAPLVPCPARFRCGGADVVVAAALDPEGAAFVPVGLGSHAINHAADSATAKDHRVRTFEPLHPLDIVELAAILGVVADAVAEEIGRRAVAPEDRRVSIRPDEGRVGKECFSKC